MSDRVVADVWWDRLGWDLTAVILCKLPLRSMVRASAVCKAWRAVLLQLFQQQQKKKPWLFLRGQNNVVPSLGRSAFAYDPSDDSDEWVSFNLPPDCFAGAGGIAFAFDSASASLTLAPLLLRSSHYYCDSQIAMASSLRNCNPVVACSSGCRLLRLVVVGGAGFAGGLVDMDEEEDPLPTELLEADGDGYYWRREQCAPLPPELSSSSELRSSAMVEGRFLFVCGAYSCTVAAFDLSRRAWTAPLQLRPATGLAAAFLTSGPGGHRLILAGLVEEEGPCGRGVPAVGRGPAHAGADEDHRGHAAGPAGILWDSWKPALRRRGRHALHHQRRPPHRVPGLRVRHHPHRRRGRRTAPVVQQLEEAAAAAAGGHQSLPQDGGLHLTRAPPPPPQQMTSSPAPPPLSFPSLCFFF